MNKDKALKQALELIERLNMRGWILADFETEVYATIDSLKAALEQPPLPVQEQAKPVQEPTPWRDMVVVSLVREGINKHRARELADHFAAQPVQEPVGEVVEVNNDGFRCEFNQRLAVGTKLYIAPPPPVQEPWGACVSGRVFVGRLPEHARKISEDEGAPIQWLYTTPPATQRPWVGLTEQDMPSGEDQMFDHKYFIAGMVYATKVLQEKNNAAPAAQPEQQAEPVACRFCHSKKGCWTWQCYKCGEIDDVQQPALPLPVQPEPLEYWNAVEGWVKIDEVREHFDAVNCGTIYKHGGEDRVPLYTAPPQRPWQGLTEDEKFEMAAAQYGWEDLLIAAEAKLKEKNHG